MTEPFCSFLETWNAPVKTIAPPNRLPIKTYVGPDMVIPQFGEWARYIKSLKWSESMEKKFHKSQLLQDLIDMPSLQEPTLRVEKEQIWTPALFSECLEGSMKNIESALIQVVGNCEEMPCKHCINGHGLFAHCLRVPNTPACGNCHWAANGARCSFNTQTTFLKGPFRKIQARYDLIDFDEVDDNQEAPKSTSRKRKIREKTFNVNEVDDDKKEVKTLREELDRVEEHRYLQGQHFRASRQNLSLPTDQVNLMATENSTITSGIATCHEKARAFRDAHEKLEAQIAMMDTTICRITDRMLAPVDRELLP
ncbi:hypothetical protein N7495_008466 [Penicillium taxi]|uniref:uncharacterized protein n=1 Tax=Penicillium taxi TaxID=168475 RepID=UPI002545644C|nr:uncharacterized protein N7495_008466 [Penicillium taxi]KAJ5888425.1 hypothetical protein N7495_008466 [Penicillium taxi]